MALEPERPPRVRRNVPPALDQSRIAAYCCYGCRFAHAIAQEQGNKGAIRWTIIRLGAAIFFTMILMAFTVTMWSLDAYDVQSETLQTTLSEVFRWGSMVFALPVLLLLGLPLLQNSVDSWRRNVYSTDLLIGLAVVSAYLTSVVNVVRESGAIYFEVGAMVLVMVTLGRWIEATGKQKATKALDRLLTRLPEAVIRLDQNQVETKASSTSIAVDDILRVCAGERFATDALITDGQTTADEQVFTGDSLPVCKTPGDSVLAGTVNLDGDVLVRVTSPFREGSFGRLLNLLQKSRNARGYHERLADKAASWLFPVVAVTATATFAWHLSSGIAFAIQATMSVLLMACPCALGLAAPLAVWTALGTAVRQQVLFRSGEAVERLADVKAICLDKTGALTTGTPHVNQTAVFRDINVDHALHLAAQLASSSSHPFARAVAMYVADGQPARSVAPPNGERAVAESVVSGHSPIETDEPALHTHDRDVLAIPVCPSSLQHPRTVPGGGVEAMTCDGHLVRLGSVEFSCCSLHQSDPSPDLSKLDLSALDLCVACTATVPLGLRIQLDRLRMAADQQSASIVLLSVDRIPAFGFLITESVRPEAQLALRRLSKSSQVLYVLSGDRSAKGRFLREQLQVGSMHIECSLSPEQKVLRVAEIRRKYGTTVMVGDGINDAPALAASDVGIAIDCGADVSRDSAQVCLLNDDLTRIPWSIDLARRTRSVIRQNLAWAFGYNIVGVGVAATGILNPAIAAGLMMGSSLLVISNSLRNADLRQQPVPGASKSSNGTPVAETDVADSPQAEEAAYGEQARH
ncbi:MAG: cation-translocating P-type ATPase [Fuerstiella sp.]|nr:cation-translocating P-type ATPase [Fuerstiella sp.]MCP4855841.1 cation-translocating P-type ATPase [Fuerstiella sp.]